MTSKDCQALCQGTVDWLESGEGNGTDRRGKRVCLLSSPVLFALLVPSLMDPPPPPSKAKRGTQTETGVSLQYFMPYLGPYP